MLIDWSAFWHDVGVAQGIMGLGRDLLLVDTGCAGIHHSIYWMPIHYDTIEDGQNKTSHRLFSK